MFGVLPKAFHSSSPASSTPLQCHQRPSKIVAGTTAFLLQSLLLLWSGFFQGTDPLAVSAQQQMGCTRQGRPLCCTGRNASCKSRDTPMRPMHRLSVPSRELAQVYCQDRAEPIGFTGILPGFVALDKAGEQMLGQRGSEDGQNYFRVFEAKQNKMEGDDEELALEFGWPWEQWATYERLITDQNWPLIRYSLLNRHLPLRIVKRPSTGAAPQGRRRGQEWAGDEQWLAFYLAETSPECFCDQFCVKYGDCCADYLSKCPAVDCQLSAWSTWSDCSLDGNASCGIGIRTRRRQVLRPRANAGAECPSDLEQQIGCFRECRPEQFVKEAAIGGGRARDEAEYTAPDVTTVALLLDYRFNKSRQTLPQLFRKGQLQRTGGSGNRKGWRDISSEEPWRKRAYHRYCVHYKIEWLNRNCLEPEWRWKLAAGQQICAECQPEAQYHRPRARCASDLEDGQSGFWKLIGPKSCYGIWRRLLAADSDCDCPSRFPQLKPFLLV